MKTSWKNALARVPAAAAAYFLARWSVTELGGTWEHDLGEFAPWVASIMLFVGCYSLCERIVSFFVRTAPRANERDAYVVAMAEIEDERSSASRRETGASDAR